ncbi:MAG: riboflavin synthase subunit alpha [Verrucomicrobia bacterium RIFCSPHIGHO2_12_FULL_41_10]|nr:MAG: riboflavin synthase subunit alpha [Verrucomicrobia bacterium RIFCSPHIGHO2_12_FULL_41_10]HLB34341.1 riboflavin synthase subunit alpha [Chthoniobacterales bacterium]
MYTGITKGLFQVIHVDKKPFLITYTVDLNENLVHQLGVGDSVSVDGVCQTVVAREGHKVTFQAGKETLLKTTLCDLFEGRMVSIERSFRFGDENGGHELAGHIFETGTVVGEKSSGDKRDLSNLNLTIQCTPHCLKYIFEKGFIGVDGSSLTVGQVDREQSTFEVHLIPETLRLTNFGNKQLGDRVNIEIDAKNVVIIESLERLIAPLERRIKSLEDAIHEKK